MSTPSSSRGFEPTRARAYVWDTLHADATMMSYLTGGLHIGLAPDGAQPIYGTLHVPSAPDHTTANAIRVWSDVLVQLTLTGTIDQAATLEAAADRADVLLQRTGPVATSRGGTALACVREDTVVLEPVVGGQRYQELHLSYRVPTQVLM